MAAFDTYMKRKRRRELAGSRDVYQFDEVPGLLRRQIAIVLEATFGPWWQPAPYFMGDGPPNGNQIWEYLASTMEREVSGFPNRLHGNQQQRCFEFALNAEHIDEWLSFVELACRFMSNLSADGKADLCREQLGARQSADDALTEINDRFREHSLGYQFENHEIIRVDSQFVHSEIVKPALHLLAGRGFEKANDDFMIAHRQYRDGHFKDAVVATNRAFESTLKAICTLRGWTYDPGARATDLLTIVRSRGLFPAYLDRGFDTYIAMLKTGLPEVRNNAGGHGQAPGATPVSDYIASYAIHLTAANIVLVMNAYKGGR